MVYFISLAGKDYTKRGTHKKSTIVKKSNKYTHTKNIDYFMEYVEKYRYSRLVAAGFIVSFPSVIFPISLVCPCRNHNFIYAKN